MLQKMAISCRVLMFVTMGLALLWVTEVMAQTEPDPAATDPEVLVVDPTVPPAYIEDLIENTDLTPEQVEQMALAGIGWGEIRIGTNLAEQIAANSLGTETPLTFDEALAVVLTARTEGLGFGEIANANNVKIGELMGNRNRIKEPASGDGLEAEEGVQSGQAVQTRQRKRSVFARMAGFLGFGKSKRLQADDRPVAVAGANANAAEKTEKVAKVQKMERVEKPSKPEKPEKPERPERPERPEKPEKPERGPRW